MIRHALYLVFLVAIASTSAGEWHFDTPPSATTRFPVHADWRAFGEIELEIDVVEPPENPGDVHCSFFFETKQDWWFESAVSIDLRKQGKQTVSFSLMDGTTDWRCPDLRREFGTDVLRLVKSWGIKVFSTKPAKGKLNLGALKLIPVEQTPPSLVPAELPPTVSVGQIVKPGFYLYGFRGNPFLTSDVHATIMVNGPGVAVELPAVFCQVYSRHHLPYGQTAKRVPFDKPRWQAVWVPPVPGTYSLEAKLTVGADEQSVALGSLTVTAATASPSVSSEPGVDTFTVAYNDVPILQYTEDGWMQPPASVDTRRYVHRQLDWSPEWGNYVGIGEFDQKQAWLLEEWLQTIKSPAKMPMLIFSEDELDNQGTYNWKDNPLNLKKNGSLRVPSAFFRSPMGYELVKSRARYAWSRYGHLPGMAGVLILVNRPHDSVVNWVGKLTRDLQQEFPGLTVYCNNPGLERRSRVTPLKMTYDWTTDTRLSRQTLLSKDRQHDFARVTGRYPGSTAIIYSKDIQHWCDAEMFAVDVHTSETAGNEIKVMCSLRVDRDTVFQSSLKWLRGADWNRVLFSLTDPEQWSCFDQPDRTFTPWDLLNIHEVSLRFFCDQPSPAILKVRNPHLLYATEAALEARPPMAVTLRKPAPETVPQYERFELDLDINRFFPNPYDPDVVSLDLRVTSPSGRKLSHPGFFYEPWGLVLKQGHEVARRSGTPHWKIRFTPGETGRYTWRAVVRSKSETAAYAGGFTCTPSDARGFVRRAADGSPYFEFSNGDFFYPIGHNLRSPSDRRPGIYTTEALGNANLADQLGTRMYSAWFKKMKMNGENFTRIWMSPWWCGLEWTPRTPGYYGIGYYNQENAARLDTILDMAAEHGIYINLETNNHGTLSSHIDAEWQYHPYNKRNPGGFLNYATDFFYSPKAMRLDQQKMRYIIARWGHSTQVAIWGLMTEVEWVEAYFRGISWAKTLRKRRGMPRPYYTLEHRPATVQWMRRASSYLRANDAHPHIVTTHLSNPQNGIEFWGQPGIQVVHNNAYTSFTGMWQKQKFIDSNGVADVVREFDQYFMPISDKPRLIGEWGGHHRKNSETQLKVELHTGLWAMFMTNCAGATGYWWWNLIDSHDLYKHYKALAAYAAGEDRRGKGLKSRRAELDFPKEHDSLVWERQGLILHNRTQIYAYIYPRAINLKKEALQADSWNDPNFEPSGSGYLLAPSTTRSGTYAIEYWDTFQGKIIATSQITLSKENQKIPIIDHRVDLALKLKLLSASAVDDTKDYYRIVKPVATPDQPQLQGNNVLMETWFGEGLTLGRVDWDRKPAKQGYLPSFEIPRHTMDNYATRITARVEIPTTGRYQFFIASDDESKLVLSETGRISDLKRVAYLDTWTHSNEWKKYSTQQSTTFYFKRGTTILLRAYHVERSSGDHLSVGWSINQGPISIIPGKYCRPAR